MGPFQKILINIDLKNILIKCHRHNINPLTNSPVYIVHVSQQIHIVLFKSLKDMNCV